MAKQKEPSGALQLIVLFTAAVAYGTLLWLFVGQLHNWWPAIPEMKVSQASMITGIWMAFVFVRSALSNIYQAEDSRKGGEPLG